MNIFLNINIKEKKKPKNFTDYFISNLKFSNGERKQKIKKCEKKGKK